MPKTFKLSTQKINSYGFVVLTSGIDLSQFNSNPVMLYNHNPNIIPGKWNNVRIEGTDLLAEAEFDEGDSEAMKLSAKVDKGYLNGVSIGLVPVEWELDRTNSNDPFVCTKCLLVEASLTPTPSNGEAVVLMDENGKVIDKEQLSIILSANNLNPKIKEPMKKIEFMIAALSLSADATEDQVLAAIKKLSVEHAQLKADNEDLKKKVDTLNGEKEVSFKLSCEQLVDGAIAGNKITAAQREQFLKLAKSDFNTTKELVEGMVARKSLSASIQGGADGKADAFKDFTYDDFHKKAPRELARIKEQEPERYQQLFDAKYTQA